MTKITRGTVREDGRVFFRYQKRSWNTYEIWLKPEAYAIYLAKSIECSARKNCQQPQTMSIEARAARNAYRRQWRGGNPLARLACNVRSRINEVLRENKTSASIKYLGCSLEVLKSHLERQFTADMCWDNYGRKGWHVDHIEPLGNCTTLDELIARLHYTNLQPLWWRDNLRKGARHPK